MGEPAGKGVAGGWIVKPDMADYIGISCNDSDTLVKENVCWIAAAVTLVSHSNIGTMKIWQ